VGVILLSALPVCFFYLSLVNYAFLPSFPTRRSSDLKVIPRPFCAIRLTVSLTVNHMIAQSPRPVKAGARLCRSPSKPAPALTGRSEEHTSELQSRFDLVCRLLLEKKNRSTYFRAVHL